MAKNQHTKFLVPAHGGGGLAAKPPHVLFLLKEYSGERRREASSTIDDCLSCTVAKALLGPLVREGEWQADWEERTKSQVDDPI